MCATARFAHARAWEKYGLHSGLVRLVDLDQHISESTPRDARDAQPCGDEAIDA